MKDFNKLWEKFGDIMKDFNKLWEKFGDIPINKDEEIEEDFLHFKKGTDRFEIWHWFEETYDITLGDKFNRKKEKICY